MTKHWTLYRRSSFSDPFNASHDSGSWWIPVSSLSPRWTIAGCRDECLRRVGDLSWDHPSSGRGWLAAANSCTAGGQTRRPEETGGDRRRPEETGGDRRRPEETEFRKSHEECDRGTRWNQHMEYNNSMYIYIQYIYISIYIYILHIYGYSTIGHTSHILHRLVTFSLNDTHTHACTQSWWANFHDWRVCRISKSPANDQGSSLVSWCFMRATMTIRCGTRQSADPRWRSPVSTRLGALWNVVHSTMLGRFTVKLPSGYLT